MISRHDLPLRMKISPRGAMSALLLMFSIGAAAAISQPARGAERRSAAASSANGGSRAAARQALPIAAARQARPVAAVAPPNVLATMMQVASVNQMLGELQANLEALRGDTLLSAPERARRLAGALQRCERLQARLEILNRQVAAIPDGNPLIPDLVGLNADSLARALASSMEWYFRIFGNERGQALRSSLLQAEALSPPGIPRVIWSEHPGAPLPVMATRAFSGNFPVAGTVERVVLMHRYGDVRIEPGPDGQVQVSGQVTVQGNLSREAAQALADSVRLESEIGTSCVLAVRMPALRSGTDEGIRVDLTLRVPRTLPLSVKNAYGDLGLKGLGGPVDGAVAFGDLTAEDLTGDVRLAGRNGDMKLSGMGGTVTVESQFGTLTARGLRGPITLRGNNSEVDLQDLLGGAQISINYGSLGLRNAVGPIGVITQNVDIDLASVRGPVSLNSQFGKVTVAQVAGSLTAQCLNGSLSSLFVEQAQDIQGRSCQIEVRNPGGDVKVRGESAPVMLSLPEITAGHRYEATTRYGNVTLEVPEHSSVAIQAATNFGAIVSDLPLRRSDAGDWQHGETLLGRGDSQVSIEAISSSIRIARTGR